MRARAVLSIFLAASALSGCAGGPTKFRPGCDGMILVESPEVSVSFQDGSCTVQRHDGKVHFAARVVGDTAVIAFDDRTIVCNGFAYWVPIARLDRGDKPALDGVLPAFHMDASGLTGAEGEKIHFEKSGTYRLDYARTWRLAGFTPEPYDWEVAAQR